MAHPKRTRAPVGKRQNSAKQSAKKWAKAAKSRNEDIRAGLDGQAQLVYHSAPPRDEPAPITREPSIRDLANSFGVQSLS